MKAQSNKQYQFKNEDMFLSIKENTENENVMALLARSDGTGR